VSGLVLQNLLIQNRRPRDLTLLMQAQGLLELGGNSWRHPAIPGLSIAGIVAEVSDPPALGSVLLVVRGRATSLQCLP
jgi:hypothetical protein